MALSASESQKLNDTLDLCTETAELAERLMRAFNAGGVANPDLTVLQQALEAALVHKTGSEAETITGVKTFSSSPIVPNASANGEAVNKGQLDSATAVMTGATTQASGTAGLVPLPGAFGQNPSKFLKATGEWKPVLENDGYTKIYVDAVNGSDTNDGFSAETAVKTIATATGILSGHYLSTKQTYATPRCILYVMPGTYSGNDNQLTFNGHILSSVMPLYIYIKGNVTFSGLLPNVNMCGSVVFAPNGDGAKVTFTAPSNASYFIRVMNSSLLVFNANLDVVLDCQNIASNGSVFYCSHNAYLSLSSNITVKNATMGLGQLFYSTLQGLIVNNASFTLQNNTFNYIFNAGYGCTVNNATTNVSATNSTVTRFASVNALSLVATSSRGTWASSTIANADIASNGGVITG